MTLEQIKASDKQMLVPSDINEVLGCDAHSIRLQARDDPRKLGFNVVVIGTRTLIPRVPFVQYIEQHVGGAI